jgi:hypothetical protein
MPQLREDATSIGMDSVGYLPPGVALRIVVDAGGANPPLPVLANPGAFSDDQAWLSAARNIRALDR